MEFQNYASTETSALIAQLLATQSGAALQQLTAVREALDAAARALSTPAHLDQEIHDLVVKLTGAADTEVRRVRDEAAASIDAVRAELAAQQLEHERLAATLAKAEAEIAILRSELQTATERADAAERDLSVTVDAHAEVEGHLRKMEADWKQASHARKAVEGDLAHAHATVQQLLADLDQMRAQLERHTAENAGLQSQLAQAQELYEQRDLLAVQLEASNMRIHGLEGELARAHETREQRDTLAVQFEASNMRIRALEGELAHAHETREQRDALAAQVETGKNRSQVLEAAQAEHEEQIRQLTARLDAALQSEARLQEKLTSRPTESPGDQTDVDALRGEVDRMISLLDASARAVTEMAAATSSTDLLTELLKRLSLQFSRVALFRFRSNRLEGEQQIGFDDGTDMAKLVFPVSVDSILSRAVNTGAAEALTGENVAARAGTPFGGAPTAAVALPVLLQGAPIAVVYADDADMPDWARGPAVHESSIGFARLLVGQASVLLLRHTHELKTLAELAQYATTLLQEAKEMYLADAQAGKSADLLRSRLKDNLECASQLYTYRAAMEGTAAAALLDEQILAEIETGTPFAKDLAKVVNQMTAGDLHITAEAS